MTTIEIVQFPATEAYLADNKILDKGFGIVIKAEGCINVYYGVQTENPKTGVYVAAWETYEHHMAFTERADFPALVAELSPAFTGEPSLAHFITDKDTGDSVYSAPLTEFSVWKLKEGKTEEEFRPRIERLAQVIDNVKGAHPPCVWGRGKENEKAFYATVGWDSIEAQVQAASPEVLDIIKSVQEIAEVQLFHASLKKVSVTTSL